MNRMAVGSQACGVSPGRAAAQGHDAVAASRTGQAQPERGGDFLRWAVRALIAAAATAGAWFSWDFGAQLGGIFMGLVVAANGGVISALLAGALLDRLLPHPRSS